MKIITTIQSDLSRRGVGQILEAVQNDANTRCAALELTDNGAAWNVPAGVTAAVAFQKPDGHKGLYDTLPDGSAAVTIAGSTVTAVLAPQVLTCAGDTAAAVVLFDKNLNRLATFPFAVSVSPDPSAGAAVSSDYYRYSTMESVSEEVEAALASLEESKESFLSKAEEALSAVHDAATEDAPAIICEAMGDAVTVTDASDRLLKGLTLCGKTTQSGTPSPDTPAALVPAGAGGAVRVTVAGSNLLPYPYLETTKTVDGITFTDHGDGTITVNGTANSAVSFPLADGVLLPAGYCYLTCTDTAQNQARITVYKNGTWYGEAYGGVLMVASGSDVFKFTASVPGGRTASNLVLKPRVNVGEEALPFEPYKTIQTFTASTPGGLPGIPVTSDGNYTDEAGQAWACDEMDFARGVYVQRVGVFTADGTEEWKLYGSSAPNAYSYNQLPPIKNIAYAECSHFANHATGVAGILHGEFTVRVEGEVHMKHTGCDTVEAFKGWLAGQYAAGTPVTLHYRLATPIETPLTAEALAAFASLHGNKPNTTVCNDGAAGMKLTYMADTKAYIDNQFTALRNAILSAGANV